MELLACLLLTSSVLCTMGELTATPTSLRHEDDLRQQLLDGYNKNALPSERTNISMRITIRHFAMNEKLQSVDIDAWVVWTWIDPHLRWNTYQYTDVPKLSFPYGVLWQPDILLYNNADIKDVNHYAHTNFLVFPDGKVMYVPPSHLKASCVMDLTYWPHDTHNCTVKFGSWVHDGDAVDLQLMDDKPKLDLTELSREGKNLTRGQWRMLDGAMRRNQKYYDCCTEPYVDIIMSLLIQRDAPAYCWTVQLPVIILSFLTMVVFLLPPAASQKLVFGGLCLILDMIFLDYCSDVIQNSPSHTPLILKLVSETIFLTAVSVVVSAVVLRIVHNPHTCPLPNCIVRILTTLGSCLFLTSYRAIANRRRAAFSQTTMKGDDVEIVDNGSASLYPQDVRGGLEDRDGGEWLLLGAVIDRVCLLAFLVIFIINMLSFIPVL